MPALIGPIGTVVNMNQAVNGNAMGNPAYASSVDVANQIGGQAAIIANYNASLASANATTLATTILNNMFVTTAAGVSAANVTALTSALSLALSSYPTAKGQVISNLANLLGGLESDSSWGPAALAFNNQAAADYVYSTTLTNTQAGVPSAVTTYTLTTSADGPGAIAPAINTNGTSGADTYNGTISAAAANGDSGTLNSFDNIAGGLGVDTLIARITSLGGATTIAPTMSSVDTVLLGSVDASGNIGTLNLASATGTTTVGFKDTASGSNQNIINAATTAAVMLDNSDGTANNRVNLGSNSGRSGTADAFALTIQGGSGSSSSVADFGLITSAAAADTSFEVANITIGAGAANFINFGIGGANIKVINASGAGTPSTSTTNAGQVLVLTEAANFANVETINASGLTTGGLNISTTSAQNTTFTGSGFNDRLNITAGVGNLTGADVINFGTGALDTLAFGTTADFRAVTLGTATTALINAITTADAIEASTAGAIQLRAADWTTVNTFVFSGATNGVASTNNVIVTGLETADTLRITADIRTIGAAGAVGATHATTGVTGAAGTAGVDSLSLGGQAVGQTASLVLTGGVDLTAAGGAGGAGGAATATVGGTGGAGGVGGAGNSAIDVANGGANIGTLNISSIGTSVNTLIGGAGGAGGAGGQGGATAAQGQGGAAAAGGAGAVGIDNGAGLTLVNITGTADLTIAGGAGGAAGAAGAGATAGATAAAGAAAAGFSSAVNVNASTFTGVLTVSGSTAADAITGGSNNDILTTMGGLDSLTGGAGTDDFRINGTAVTSATAFITISDFGAGDQISILSQVRAAGGALVGGGTALLGTPVFNTTAINVSSAASFAAALDLASALAGNVNTQVTWFNWTDGNTYVVVDNTAAGTYTAATDAIIQLTGVKTLTVGSVDFA